MLMNRDLTNDEIRQRYGLEPYEWTSTLDGTMAAIVGKDMPDRDVYANALLRDGVKAFEREMELDEYEGRVDTSCAMPSLRRHGVVSSLMIQP